MKHFLILVIFAAVAAAYAGDENISAPADATPADATPAEAAPTEAAPAEATPTVVAPAEATQSAENEKSNFSSAVTISKEITNILFFLCIGAVGVLSYLQARRTIFSPIKTEIFKLQIDSLQEVLEFFYKHERQSIDDHFDYQRILWINTMDVIDDYIEHFFSEKVKLKEDHKKKRREESVGAIVSHKFMEKNFERIEYETKSNDSEPKDITPIEPAIQLSIWQDYHKGMINFTQDYSNSMDKLRRFQSSPLLPQDLKKLVSNFEKDAHENLRIMMDVLTEFAQELPSKYPTVESVTTNKFDWVWNEYNRKKTEMSGAQNAILAFLNNYLLIEEIRKEMPNKAG